MFRWQNYRICCPRCHSSWPAVVPAPGLAYMFTLVSLAAFCMSGVANCRLANSNDQLRWEVRNAEDRAEASYKSYAAIERERDKTQHKLEAYTVYFGSLENWGFAVKFDRPRHLMPLTEDAADSVYWKIVEWKPLYDYVLAELSEHRIVLFHLLRGMLNGSLWPPANPVRRYWPGIAHGGHG